MTHSRQTGLRKRLPVGIVLALAGLASSACSLTSPQVLSVDTAERTALPGTEPVAAARTGTVPLPIECTGEALEVEGHRTLALIVGVAAYQAPSVPDLVGPPNDARMMLDLLTGPGGYGVPMQNVCLLVNQQATTANFREAFEQSLVARARPGDVVLIHFSGHGSQDHDGNGDEPDAWDETLLLQDARTGEVRDLIDDELNEMLARLYARTDNITMLLDSCNSGTATRDGSMQARFVPPQLSSEQKMTPAAASPPANADSAGDEAGHWQSAAMPGLVVLAAAADGTSALERNGEGIFTRALVQVLGEPNAGSLTWAQVGARLRPLIAARSGQVPLFQGRLDREVLSIRERSHSRSWELASIEGGQVGLRGTPMPGWGSGAELRVYDPASPASDLADPGKAVAMLKVEHMQGFAAKAVRLDAHHPGQRGPRVGDLAVLARPGIDALQLRVRIRPAKEAGGVPLARAQEIETALRNDSFTRDVILLELTDAAFELIQAASGRLQLIGPEGRIRNTYPASSSASAAAVVESLSNHARQAALLQLSGGEGDRLRNNQTLQVQAVPEPLASQLPCAQDKPWHQAPPNTEQRIPLCYRWRIQVTVSPDTPYPLLIGGVVLSSDGTMTGFPKMGEQQPVPPGGSYTIPFRLRAELPLEARDHVIVFGTRENEPVRWDQMTTAQNTKGPAAHSSNLAKIVANYLTPGTKGGVVEELEAESPWTSSHMTALVQANSAFLSPKETETVPSGTKGWTIQRFDIRPYLPDDVETALFKVLNKEYDLTNYAERDGIPYRSHAWQQSSDALNLKQGTDCSRAIWFAFTRAGLKYNRDNAYLTTKQMADPEGLMADEFERCDTAQELKLGDVLVYRDAGREKGHTVMVIDPDKRIAWGSQGWDGNVLEGLKPDIGIEYQVIKYRKDWKQWSRSTMTQAACWRYRRFTEEGKRPGGQPGVEALQDPCSSTNCRKDAPAAPRILE